MMILTAAMVGVLFTGCSEEVDVHTRSMDRCYLVVEAMLTDNRYGICHRKTCQCLTADKHKSADHRAFITNLTEP